MIRDDQTYWSSSVCHLLQETLKLRDVLCRWCHWRLTRSVFETLEPQFINIRLTDRQTGRTHWLLDRTAALLSHDDDDDEGGFSLYCLSFQLSDSFYRLFADQRSWTKNCWDKITETHGQKSKTQKRIRLRVDLCTCSFFWCFKSIKKLSNFSLNRRHLNFHSSSVVILL